ncbi:hypothetical protein VTL71DRAFT_13211, partial [Oculimacula yallundae]
MFENKLNTTRILRFRAADMAEIHTVQRSWEVRGLLDAQSRICYSLYRIYATIKELEFISSHVGTFAWARVSTMEDPAATARIPGSA